MRHFIAAFGVVIGLQGVVTVDRVQAGPASWTQAPAVATPVTSKIQVSVPDDETELQIDGTAIMAVPVGITRMFQSPPLEAGKNYEYKFTAKWRPNNYTVITRSKTVQFTAGDEVAVDLTTEDPNDRAEIRYVPTPTYVVREMIVLAGVNKDDVVFEPGCGDSRITIAAMKAGAKKGVGIDLDPARVAESKVNVKEAGLEDKIDIRLGDALDIKDLSDASVVFLYMGNEFDKLIRPILWKQLKVGTRIVSHRFTMGDWEPDKSIDVLGESDEGTYTLHLWTVTQEIKARAEKN